MRIIKLNLNKSNIPFITLFRYSSTQFLFLFLIFFGCSFSGSSKNDPYYEVRKAVMVLDSGEKIDLELSITNEEQVQGLSGIMSHEYPNDKGMLFFNLKDAMRKFWMPDTYFDLDIFFLDKDLKVLAVSREVPHHPGRLPNPPISITEEVYCRHVLELKSESPLAKKILIGMNLNLESLPNHNQYKDPFLKSVSDLLGIQTKKSSYPTAKILAAIEAKILK